jgi:hypothetical protein
MMDLSGPVLERLAGFSPQLNAVVPILVVILRVALINVECVLARSKSWGSHLRRTRTDPVTPATPSRGMS